MANVSAYGLRLSRNYGQDDALPCGIRTARPDVTVTIGDDLRNPPWGNAAKPL